MTVSDADDGEKTKLVEKQFGLQNNSNDELTSEDELTVSETIHVQEEQKKTGTMAAALLFSKAYLGSGMMAMSSTYLSGGVIPTTILVYFVAVLGCICFTLLFRVRDRIRETTSIPPWELHFERVVEEILGPTGRMSVLAAIVFTQAGFSTAYCIFVAGNLQLLYPAHSLYVYGVIQIPILILLCWIRQLKYLSPFALGGVFSICLAVFTVCLYCFRQEIIPYGIPEGALLRNDWSSFPIAYGVVVYLFEGIGMILPIEQKMKHPEQFPKVMWSVHLLVATLVSAFGLVGYLAFYLCTAAPIVDNLPPTGPLVVTTVWSLSIALIFTYPIMMYPVFVILEKALFGGGAPETKIQHAKTMALRAGIVVLSVGIAIGIPQFDLFLSLIGGMGSAQLMFIFPPIVYAKCFWNEISIYQKVMCGSLLGFGLITVVTTTLFTIIQLVCTFDGSCVTDGCSLGERS
mmetsp:Transcript_36978/g.58168  ORF Transcript_36978/g.58168 Transcript_36978/m.58168 type:complete len:460 (-) Transcript_36978:1885-3264(-)